jgi:hypothetical protein
MAAQIDPRMTFDEMESEIVYTPAALAADPDARDLVPTTAGWMALIDEARAASRASREAVTRSDALRRVANGRLDATCTTFGDELLLAVGKDRASARWKRFLQGGTTTMSAFIKLPLAEQVRRVKGWFAITDDTVLDRHRAALTTWSAATDDALTATTDTATVRGAAAVVRERVAEDLTRARDGLEATLVQRATERGLARSWPSLFFRTASTPAHRGAAADGPSADPATPTA